MKTLGAYLLELAPALRGLLDDMADALDSNRRGALALMAIGASVGAVIALIVADTIRIATG